MIDYLYRIVCALHIAFQVVACIGGAASGERWHPLSMAFTMLVTTVLALMAGYEWHETRTRSLP